MKFILFALLFSLLLYKVVPQTAIDFAFQWVSKEEWDFWYFFKVQVYSISIIPAHLIILWVCYFYRIDRFIGLNIFSFERPFHYVMIAGLLLNLLLCKVWQLHYDGCILMIKELVFMMVLVPIYAVLVRIVSSSDAKKDE